MPTERPFPAARLPADGTGEVSDRLRGALFDDVRRQRLVEFRMQFREDRRDGSGQVAVRPADDGEHARSSRPVI